MGKRKEEDDVDAVNSGYSAEWSDGLGHGRWSIFRGDKICPPPPADRAFDGLQGASTWGRTYLLGFVRISQHTQKSSGLGDFASRTHINTRCRLRKHTADNTNSPLCEGPSKKVFVPYRFLSFHILGIVIAYSRTALV